MNSGSPSMRIATIIFVLGFLSLMPLFSQESTGNIEEVSDSTEAVYDDGRGLYGGMGYGNNMIYLGSSISQNQPYIYSALTYALTGELFISLSSIHLSGFRPLLPLANAALSYSHTFNSWFDFSAGLYGYMVAPALRDTLFGNFLYADATVGIDWRILYSKISAGGLISDYSQLYLQFRNSRYFQTPDIFRGRANISFDPYINIIAGTLTTAETITSTDTVFSTFPPFGGGRPRIDTSTETVYSSRFSLLEADFGLPVSLNFDLFSIELEAGYILPLSSLYSASVTRGFLFTASAYFRIF